MIPALNLHVRLTFAVAGSVLIGWAGAMLFEARVGGPQISVWLFPALAPLAFVLARIAVVWGLAPLRRLVAEADAIERIDRTRRLEVAGDDETARLGATLDRMLDRLEDAEVRERRLTSDASHELRAPISVIRAEADLMLRRERGVEEYQRALQSIAVHADRLEALTRDLLAAVRGERIPSRELVPVALGPVVREAAAFLAPLAEERALQLRLEIDDEVVVLGLAHDLSRATICALHNAIKFAPEGGTVELSCRRVGAHVIVDVEDDGPGFSPQALRHAVDRFWQDDVARTNAALRTLAGSGSGLGLSIANAIVTALGGTLRLSNRRNRGACVRFEFAATAVAAAATPSPIA